MTSMALNPAQKYSTQMKCVLLILEADKYLKDSVLPFIDLKAESINWDPILKMPFGSGHRAAVTWMYGLWVDKLPSRRDPFESAFSMSPRLQVAALKALALRWGLSS